MTSIRRLRSLTSWRNFRSSSACPAPLKLAPVTPPASICICWSSLLGGGGTAHPLLSSNLHESLYVVKRSPCENPQRSGGLTHNLEDCLVVPCLVVQFPSLCHRSSKASTTLSSA